MTLVRPIIALTLACVVQASTVAAQHVSAQHAAAGSGPGWRRCAVHGRVVRLESVEVHPAGWNLSIAVERTPATAQLRPGSTVADIDIAGTLEFRGETNNVPYVLSRDVDTLGSRVHLAPDAHIDRARAYQDGSLVDVTIDGRVEIRGLPVACDALSLDAPPALHSLPRVMRSHGDGTSWIAARNVVRLRALPGSTPLRVALHEPFMVTFERTATRGPWWHVQWLGMRGSSLHGWVHASELRPMPNGSYGSLLPRGHGTCGRGRVGGPGIYFGPASVEAGTTVFASRGSGAWARVARADAVTVYSVATDPWVAIRAVPGLEDVHGCGELLHAYVLRSAVHFPDDR